jgi:membrane protease YdiL (CAAX protease family)
MTTIDTPQAPAGRWTSSQNLIVIASPIFIVLLGTILARVSDPLLGKWAWALTVPVYWLAMSIIIYLVSGKQKWLSWYKKPRGSKIWLVIGLLIGLSAFPLLLIPNASLLRTPLLTILWFSFGLINGTIEESYWRGFLFTEIRGWPRWLTVTYSSVLFVAIHFLMLGTFSAALFNIPFLVILIIITVTFALMFIFTGSLRWPTISHILTDWGNMNLFVFMNLTKLF